MVERGVVGDPQQPRAERSIAPEPLEPVEGAQERVLAHVLGFVGADDAGGDPDHHGPVAVDESFERTQLAARGAPDELGVVRLQCRGGGLIRAHDPEDDERGPWVTSIRTELIFV